MDRDKRWDRTQQAYDLLVHGRGRAPRRPGAGGRARRLRARRDRRVRRRHDRRRGGEHPPRRQRHRLQLPPRPHAPDHPARWPSPASARSTAATPPRRALRDADRVRGGLAATRSPSRPSAPTITLPSVIAEHGGRQLHVAETEKYPHVTYFFGGGEEEPYEGERRELVPSPRDVPTYDHKPEMSARERGRGVRVGVGGGRAPLRDHQLRQPRHGRPHRRHPGGGDGDRDRRRVPRPRSSRRSRPPAAPASSPPTTATPTTCSSPTARRTPRTR